MKEKIPIFCRSSWTFVPFPGTGTPSTLQLRGCPMVLVGGEVRGITEKPHKPPLDPSADLALTSHSSLPIFSSVNSTSIGFPGQNLLSWPHFSWIQPPRRAHLRHSFLPG